MHVLTEHIDSGRRLRVSQGKRRYFTGVDPHVGEAHVLQRDGGVVGGGRAEMQALDELRGDEDAVARVVDGHRDGARGQPALPGTLGEGEVGAHLHAALQRHVLP